MAPKTKKPNAWLTFLSVYRSENVGNKGEKLMKQARAQWKLLTKGEKQSYLTVDTSGKESVPTKENRISVKIEPGQAENVVEEPQEQVKSFKGIRVEICIKWP